MIYGGEGDRSILEDGDPSSNKWRFRDVGIFGVVKPSDRIVGDVGADGIVLFLVTNDAFEIIPLPYGEAGGFTEDVYLTCGIHFEPADDFG